jgi:uncharacterized RDD family membrane protein YckC
MEMLTLSPREQGLQALREGDLDAAVTLLERAAAEDERDAEAQAFRGVAYSQKGLHAQGVDALRAAVRLQPRDPRYHFNLGVALESAGDKAAAARAFTEVVRLYPAHPQARAKLHALSAASSAPSAAWSQGQFLPRAVDPGRSSTAPAMSAGEAFGRRLAASLVDGVITWVLSYSAGFLIGLVVPFAAAAMRGPDAVRAVLPLVAVLGGLTGLVIGLVYYVGMLCRYGQTWGKVMLGIRVVGPDGRHPSLGRALLRETIGKIVSCLPFCAGCLWMLRDAEQRTWHDWIAGTRVERA